MFKYYAILTAFCADFLQQPNVMTVLYFGMILFLNIYENVHLYMTAFSTTLFIELGNNKCTYLLVHQSLGELLLQPL